MKIYFSVLLLFGACAFTSFAQTKGDSSDFALTLPDRTGQLKWHAEGFRVTESSAKPAGQEIGIRGLNESQKITFLGFLFTVVGQHSSTGAGCRDGALAEAEKEAGLSSLKLYEISNNIGVPISLVSYTEAKRNGGSVSVVRGFVGKDDVCGDLELYSDEPISGDNPQVKAVFQSYHFDPQYNPSFADFFVYGQILFQHQNYAAAAPFFERSLSTMGDSSATVTMRRIATDQAGMSYGISGNVGKARQIFEAAIRIDPDYPLYYYNLACADAQEKKLPEAKAHLQQAFARKANVLPGEVMPKPAEDDSFLPYKNDSEFWAFVTSLQ